jgi:hypothetical protein
MESCIRVSMDSLHRRMIDSPDTLQVHRTNFDDFAILLSLQQPVTTSSGHVGYIEQFRAIDEAIVYSLLSTTVQHKELAYLTCASCDTNPICLNLETKCTLIFPKCRCDLVLLVARRCSLPRWIRNMTRRDVCRGQGWLRHG